MTDTLTTCPGEGLLLRYLDGEVAADVRHAIEAHLSACPACQTEMDRLSARDRAVRAWMARHDPEPPARESYDFAARPRHAGHGSRRWVAAAAVVVALVGVAGPARGTVLAPFLDWLQRTVASSPATPPPAAANGPDGAARTASPGTSFVYRGAELTIFFDSPDTRGEMTVEPAADSLVTFRSPHPDVSLSVRPGALDVGNRAASDGDYTVTVPRTLERLRVRVRGGADAVLDVASLAASRRVPLPSPSPSGGVSP